MLRWLPGPEGRHIELGISEMNLFMALGQFGLSYELTGQHLIPIGTVYDPFVCRGLDALIYSLYVGAKMIFAGTPAGVSLSPGGRRAPEHGDALARHRAAGARFLRAGLRPRGRMGAAGSAAPVLRPRARPLDLLPALDQTDRPEADGRGARPARRGRAAPPGARSAATASSTGAWPRPICQPATRCRSRPAASWCRRRSRPRAGCTRKASPPTSSTSPARAGSTGRCARRAAQLLADARRDPDLGHLATLDPRRRAPRPDRHGAGRRLARAGLPRAASTAPRPCRSAWTSGASPAPAPSSTTYAGIDADEIVNAAMLALELNEE